jgi:hypothetical protein
VLKAARAYQHLLALRGACDRFEKSNPAMLVPEFKASRPGHDFRYVVRKTPPDRLGPMIGDVISNLRAALEYAVYELTLAHSGRELGGTAFPVCTTAQAWGQRDVRTRQPSWRSGAYKTRGIPAEARSLIREHQPYRWKRYRRRPLWVLNELWNIDKHRTLHIATTAPSIGRATVISAPQTIVKEWAYQGRPKDGAIVGRLTYLTGTTEADVQVETNLACKVVFQEGSAGLTGPVVETLETLDEYVTNFLAALAVFDPRVI